MTPLSLPSPAPTRARRSLVASDRRSRAAKSGNVFLTNGGTIDVTALANAVADGAATAVALVGGTLGTDGLPGTASGAAIVQAVNNPLQFATAPALARLMHR